MIDFKRPDGFWKPKFEVELEVRNLESAYDAKCKQLDIAVEALEVIKSTVSGSSGINKIWLKSFCERNIAKLKTNKQKITCAGAGQCDHDGSECTPENNCGEYEAKTNKDGE